MIYLYWKLFEALEIKKYWNFIFQLFSNMNFNRTLIYTVYLSKLSRILTSVIKKNKYQIITAKLTSF